MKVTLITGASSGIGEAFARKLAQKKHNLVLIARNEQKLAALCDELMLKHEILAHYVAIDLIDYQADIRLFKETENHGMEVEWLINNAGFGSMGDFAAHGSGTRVGNDRAQCDGFVSADTPLYSTDAR